jgi:hypothetical protein
MATTRTLLWGGFYTVGSATNSVTNRGSVKPIDRIMADGQFIISVPADGWVRLIYKLVVVYIPSDCTSYTGTKTHGLLGIS